MIWPFSLFRFPSLAKLRTQNCRWCPSRIGDADHYPIPLCDACFTMAWNDQAKHVPARARLFSEFPAEVREYFKQVMRRRA